jgi:glutathione synthase/RimK-type ligase-like ATP-grasp enzyme
MGRVQSIVIVTEDLDPHADIVLLTLREMGHEPIRLHTADFPLEGTMTFRLGAPATEWCWNGVLQTQGRTIDISSIRSIWWRRPSRHVLPEDWDEHERAFAYGEVDKALRGAWAVIDCYWMSFPEHIRQASFKIGQLQRAAELGFDVPRTLITTDPAEVRAFYDACAGEIIYKTLSQPTVKVALDGPLHAIYTTPITEAHLDALESIRFAPCLFQEYIPKRLELRVTVIGDDIFAAAIHSQNHDRTQHDWRHYDVDIPYTKFDLPADVAERCHRFVRSYGLNFSAMDVILTPDGRYVFIENNPNGQWYFIQAAVPELRLKEALAACLARGKGVA